MNMHCADEFHASWVEHIFRALRKASADTSLSICDRLQMLLVAV